MSSPRQRSALVLGLFLSLAVAQAQYSFTDQNPIGSVSGQFVISSAGEAPQFRSLSPASDTNIVQLKTALLAVSAERFKISLWHQLGIEPNAPWADKIYLRVHPARSLDETVTITSIPMVKQWHYMVDLPDMISKTRYARALSAVVLLELANRRAEPVLADDSQAPHATEVPSWLVDGLAQQVLATDGDKVLLTAPHAKGNELPVNRLNEAQKGIDPLAGARLILQNAPALTFDQLSWAMDEQMEGSDGGVYYASAQLFVDDLLALKNGKEKMRNLLADLPAYFNWQTALLRAYGQDFTRPLDVEKWWALQVVSFSVHSTGPRWTTDVSLVRLQQLLSVPVEFRNASNAMPVHAEISLQSALQNLNQDQRDNILRTKVRDLALVELRMAAPFGDLADGYRVVLTDFLGESVNRGRSSVASLHGFGASRKAGLNETLNKLNTLDARRRMAEAKATIALQGHSQGETTDGR